MRIAWVALVVGGCGRIAFDPTSDAATPTGDSDTRLPFTCESAFSPITVPVSSNADLAVGVLPQNLAIGFLDRTQASSPYLALLDTDHRIIGTPAQVPGTAGDALTTLTGWNDRLYIEVVDGPAHDVLLTASGITGAALFDTGTGIAGRDCIVEDGDRRERVGLIADGSILYAAYAGSSAFGTQSMNDFGMPITSMSCNPGDNHVHAMLSTTDAVCRGARVNVPVGSNAPVFDTLSVDAMNCADPRYAVHDRVLDTGTMVWRSTTGGLRTRFLDDSATQPIVVAASGASPRVASDGTNIWFVWNDGGQLFAGRTTPNAPVVTNVLDGLAFAGDESYELVRANDKVYLLVLSPAGLASYSMCDS